MSEFINFSSLAGKKGVVIGVANNMSIAWYIAEIAKKSGAEIALTYVNEVMAKRVRPLAEELGTEFVYECDVLNQESVDKMSESIKNDMGSIDFIVHAVAFSDKNELKGRYLDTSKENFLNTLNVSCFSLLTVIKGLEGLLNEGGSVLTLTYYGAEKVIPNYNVMGVAKAALECSVRYLAKDLGEKNIRINAISAGPIRTLAASGISDFKSVLNHHQQTAPLKRNTSQEDVARSSLYLLSSLSSGVTGEVHYVDCGYNIMGAGL
jgi:enoyl-[acyl-carrier protein] reductase I